MSTLTLVHVIISLVGICSGLVVVLGFVAAQRYRGWTALFLATTALTSVTGFIFFPIHPLLPSHKVGILSLVVLAVAAYALYRRHLAGHWRSTYVIGAVLALYLNVFVLIFQLFLKVPAIKALAPTQSEPPFAITQGAGLVLFVVLAIISLVRFHPDGEV